MGDDLTVEVGPLYSPAIDYRNTLSAATLSRPNEAVPERRLSGGANDWNRIAAAQLSLRGLQHLVVRQP